MTDPADAWDLDRIEEAFMGRSTRPDGLPPRTVGKYRLLRELASGAMGVVHEAEDPELRRRVAVKLLRDVPGSSEALRERFRREAQATAMLSHPNVVRTYDAGEDGGRMYIVMELIEGHPLSEILATRRYDMRPMLVLLEKAARGLAAAHEAGIVHRDVKPANILVTAAGEPKVGDFGLAHLVDSEAGLTRSGMPLGTPSYMAPEQVRGDVGRIQPATDVYALGTILYEILTGRPPHLSDSTPGIYDKILASDPILPRKLNPSTPIDIQTICLKALEKDPGARYPGAKPFADDLRNYLAGESILARPPGPLLRSVRWAKRHRTSTAVAAMLLAGLGALAVSTAAQARQQTEERRRSVGALLERGHASDRKAVLAETEEASLEDLRKETAARIPRYESAAEKQPLWDLEKRLAETRTKASRLRSESIVAFTSVFAVEPAHPGARAALAGIHFREFERAERERDAERAKLNDGLVRLYDDGTFAARLDAPGTLQIDSRPSGAEIFCFRYEPGYDRRLLPLPFRAEDGTTRDPGGKRDPPLDCTAFNRLGIAPQGPRSLPRGSYLLLIRREGFRDVRYPVLIGRGTVHSGVVNLYTDKEIGQGFAYVPAASPDEREPGDFFIRKFEVSFTEYLTFLNDRGHHTASEAIKRSPRTGPGADYFCPRVGDQIRLPPRAVGEEPISFITWSDADEYCRWRTRVAARQGEKASFRLPTDLEWERAARGSDGRAYPWGDTFDFAFAKGFHSRPLPPTWAEAMGNFAADESPYGVRDMAGNVGEWVGSGPEGRADLKWLRGGTWSQDDPSGFRVDAREVAGVDQMGSYGFRVVKVPDPVR